MKPKDFAILAKLNAHGPTYGREIAWFLKRLGFWAFTTAYGPLYMTMRKLTEKGWVETHGIGRGFTLTNAGQKAYTEALFGKLPADQDGGCPAGHEGEDGEDGVSCCL